MNRLQDGGAAFPVPQPNGYGGGGIVPSNGMTLRQYYAAKALHGMLAHPTRYQPRDCDKHLHWHDAIAKEAHELADAMIRAGEAAR